MRQQHEESQYRLLLARQAKQRAWRQRMAGSPYTVNLVGEAERVAEEMRVKQELEAWRKRYEEPNVMVATDISGLWTVEYVHRSAKYILKNSAG